MTPYLSLAIWVPILAGVAVLVLGSDRDANKARWTALAGALAAGLIVGLVLDTPDGKVVRMRLEGIGFGLLIPIYFVVTGMTFDLDSFLTPAGLALAALFLALLVAARGASRFQTSLKPIKGCLEGANVKCRDSSKVISLHEQRRFADSTREIDRFGEFPHRLAKIAAPSPA